MLFGHNSDVKVGETQYHVQTEDRGEATGIIDTTVYCCGRVVHRRTSEYKDLLPLGPEHETELKKRIDEQHRAVAEEIRSGTLKVELPETPMPATQKGRAPTRKVAGGGARGRSANPAGALDLELLNAKTWLAGKHANLQIAVREKQNGVAVAGARVVAHIDGSLYAADLAADTDANGQAKLEFEMPQLGDADSALIIEATHAGAKGKLKFQLRARPRVPTA
jgi:hypothetical protein